MVPSATLFSVLATVAAPWVCCPCASATEPQPLPRSWWRLLGILAFGDLRQEDCEFEAVFNHTGKSYPPKEGVGEKEKKDHRVTTQ